MSSHMHHVELRVNPRELTGKMAEMRVWLDEHRFEPAVFSCGRGGKALRVSVAFKAVGEAEAFARRFGGRASAA
jgi:hypothetical protein